MATMTPREAADHPTRAFLGWGAALLGLALVFWILRGLYAPDPVGDSNDATIYGVLTLVALAPGAVLTVVGLVAVGVRLGLAAHGVEPRD